MVIVDLSVGFLIYGFVRGKCVGASTRVQDLFRVNRSLSTTCNKCDALFMKKLFRVEAYKSVSPGYPRGL
jgi:hypothetical protein